MPATLREAGIVFSGVCYSLCWSVQKLKSYTSETDATCWKYTTVNHRSRHIPSTLDPDMTLKAILVLLPNNACMRVNDLPHIKQYEGESTCLRQGVSG